MLRHVSAAGYFYIFEGGFVLTNDGNTYASASYCCVLVGKTTQNNSEGRSVCFYKLKYEVHLEKR